MKALLNLPRYVFVTDQSRVFFTALEPTPEDFAYAEVGMVIIVRIADAHYFGTQKEWMPIPAGQLGHAEVDGEETGAFHGLPELFAEPASHAAFSRYAHIRSPSGLPALGTCRRSCGDASRRIRAVRAGPDTRRSWTPPR